MSDYRRRLQPVGRNERDRYELERAEDRARARAEAASLGWLVSDGDSHSIAKVDRFEAGEDYDVDELVQDREELWDVRMGRD